VPGSVAIVRNRYADWPMASSGGHDIIGRNTHPTAADAPPDVPWSMRKGKRRMGREERGERVFRSKRDGWISAVIWASAVFCAAAATAVMSGGAVPLANLVVAVVLVAAAGLMLWVLYGTSYSMADGLLRIRSGPYRVEVPLAEVTSVERSRTALAAPACSLDRVAVRYGNRCVVVSPEDRDAFVAAVLRKRQPLPSK
jgi:hypothetical protein